MSIVRIENAEVFVGLDSKVAQSQIEDHGYECRIVKIDNHTLHADYKPDYDPLRCNLTVKIGKVVKATIG